MDIHNVGDGVDGGGIIRRNSVINWIALLDESLARSSSLSYEIKIRGLFPAPPIPQ